MEEGGEQPEVLAFSLTDPEQLTNQLEAAQLDDVETEMLLDEALKLNAKLKEALRHQQLDQPASPPGGKPRSQGQGRSKQTAHPLEEQFARKQPPHPPVVHGGKARLPPIGSGPGEGGVRGKQGKGGKPGDGLVGHKPGSSSRRRQGSGKKGGKVDNRPAWDDRFSFD